MDYEILEGKTPVGTVSIEHRGLYLHIQGQFPKEKALQRLYGICGETRSYLGIVDLNGFLEKQLSLVSTPMPEACILSPLGPEEQKEEIRRETPVNPIEEEPSSPKTEEQTLDTEIGDRDYESIQEKSGNVIDPLLLADLPADYDYGQGGQSEADRTDL